MTYIHDFTLMFTRSTAALRCPFIQAVAASATPPPRRAVVRRTRRHLPHKRSGEPRSAAFCRSIVSSTSEVSTAEFFYRIAATTIIYYLRASRQLC